MRIVVLSGGIGGARFLRGLTAALRPGPGDEADHEIAVIGNTADDITLFGLRVCPDLDTVMYTLGGGIHEEQGWGRADETFSVREELAAYDVEPRWFTLGDRDIATHIVRTQMLGAGFPLSQVTEALCARWRPGVRLLPMTDDRVETHVVIEDPAAEGGRRAVHFQEYWVGMGARPVAQAVIPVGAEQATPAPGVLEAIEAADAVIVPPSNPVVSVGTILAVPGVREAIAAAGAPVVGLSPIIGGRPVRGMADKLLAAVGVQTRAGAVAAYYGPGLLDGWLVDTADSAEVDEVSSLGITCRAIPLLMTDTDATAAMAREALALAEEYPP
ncbi:MAG: 2-phospho-L-lactate transferase [Carbonactinosporaceae bacterium]